MSVPRREQRALHAIEDGICRSDPGLASMMTIFTRLAAGEPMPAHERGPLAVTRAFAVLLATAAAVVRVVACGSAACLRALAAPGLAAASYRAPGSPWASPLVRAPWYRHQ